MYVGYAFIVAELVTIAVAINILSGTRNPWIYISLMIGIVAMLSPFNYRYSRVLLMHWLTPGVHYHPEMSAKACEVKLSTGE